MDYAKDYQGAFNQPASSFGGYGHDALTLVHKAIEAGKSAEPRPSGTTWRRSGGSWG
jgi:hypothetical protein